MYGKIVGLGRSHPKKSIHNDDLSKVLDTNDEWIFSRTGIHSRYVACDRSEDTSALCYMAAVQALEQAGLAAGGLDLIIVATISPDYASPSVACIVQDRLGANNAFAFDINAACSGFIYALSTGEKFIQSGMYKNVLVVGGEVMSKQSNWQDRSTCVLFGDAAGAAVLVAGDKKHILGEDLHSNGFGDGYKQLIIEPNPPQSPFSEKPEKEPQMYMNGRYVFDFALRAVPESIRTVLAKGGLTPDDIQYFVTHQANKRIIEGVAKKMKLDISRFYINVERYGNTSAATIPIALREMYEKGLIFPGNGDKIVLTGFGAGFTWGSLLIEI